MLSNLRTIRLSTAAGVSLSILLVDLLFLFYITSYGFGMKNMSIEASMLPIPLQALPVIGVLLVSFVAWYEVSEQIFPRRAGPEIDPLAMARVLRVAALSIMTFAIVLYVPYVTGSNWFWTGLSRFVRSVPQFLGFGNWLLNTEDPLMKLNPLWQYSLSQVLATGAMLIVASFFGRVVRRPRKVR